MTRRRLRGDDPAKTFLFHLVSIRNLTSILAQGGIWSLTQVHAHDLAYTNIGHQKIKERRRQRAVPVAAEGVVADYVPFYFAPRSPMLSAISYGAVDGYEEGQDEVIYLCSTVARILELGVPWAATDRHAELAIARFYTDPAAIAREVDWELMNERYWASSSEDPDRRERRQAELLVHERVPWSAIHFVAARNEATLGRVESLLDEAGLEHRPKVALRSHWYFEDKE